MALTADIRYPLYQGEEVTQRFELADGEAPLVLTDATLKLVIYSADAPILAINATVEAQPGVCTVNLTAALLTLAPGVYCYQLVREASDSPAYTARTLVLGRLYLNKGALPMLPLLEE